MCPNWARWGYLTVSKVLSVLRKIAIALWALHIAFGIFICISGSLAAGMFIGLPAVLGIVLVVASPSMGRVKKSTPKPTSTSKTPCSPAPFSSKTDTPHEGVSRPAAGKVHTFSVRGNSRLTVPSYAVLDIETTGLHEDQDQIIELAFLKIEDGQVVDRYQTLVNPHRKIPPNITQLTGISNADIKTAPELNTVLCDLCEKVPEDIPFVGHNAAFDMKFIAAALSQCGINRDIKFIDTASLAREAFPGMENYKLSTLIETLHLLDHPQEHRAMSDVEAAHQLYLRCRDILALSKGCEGSQDDLTPIKFSSTYKHLEKSRPSDVCRTAECIDSSHPLCGKNLVFTGDLSISRKEAMQLAVNVGAVIKSGVSSKTDFLIVGKQDMDVVGSDGMSGKEEKAYALNEEGKAHIRIVDEETFMNLLNGAPESLV